MKINEIITEAISLSKYHKDFENAINKSIEQTLLDIAKRSTTSREYLQHREEINNVGSTLPVKDIFKSDLIHCLKFYIENNLQNTSAKLYPGSYIPIEFADINNDGHANGMSVALSTNFLNALALKIIGAHYNSYSDSLDSDDVYGHFFNVMTVKYHRDEIIHAVEYVVEKIIGILIHELTHVVQHGNQLVKGKYDTEYRSYLDKPSKKKPSELLRLNSLRHKYGRLPVTAEQRYRILHSSSPQEITANSNNIVYDIIKQSDIDNYSDTEELPPLNHFGPDIIYAVKHYINPTTPQEHKVYKRYVRQVANELGKYLGSIRTDKVTEVYSPQNSNLKRYMHSGEVDFYSNVWLKDSWLEHIYKDEEDVFGEIIDDDDNEAFDNAMRHLSPQLQKSFSDYLIDYLNRNDPSEIPTWASMDADNQLIKRTTWLTHFSDHAEDIWEKGFKYGIADMTTLALTTYHHDRNKYPGYNFAVIANSRDAVNIASDGKYGADFVMFQNSGVKAYHYGDEENQIMFWGKDVNPKHMIYVKKVNDEYAVMGNSKWLNKTNKDYVVIGDYKSICKWIIDHWQQYKKILAAS